MVVCRSEALTAAVQLKIQGWRLSRVWHDELRTLPDDEIAAAIGVARSSAPTIVRRKRAIGSGTGRARRTRLFTRGCRQPSIPTG